MKKLLIAVRKVAFISGSEPPSLAAIVVVMLVTTSLMVFNSCTNANAETITSGEAYSTTGNRGDVEIVKIRDCEYVFWHNGYGSDLEHYEGCNNMQHNISVMDAQISLLKDEVKRLEEENQRMGSLLGEAEINLN